MPAATTGVAATRERRRSARSAISASEGTPRSEQRELLAAPACEVLARLEEALQPRGELDEHRVTDEVAEVVVHVLEVVGVEQQQPGAVRVVRGARRPRPR